MRASVHANRLYIQRAKWDDLSLHLQHHARRTAPVCSFQTQHSKGTEMESKGMWLSPLGDFPLFVRVARAVFSEGTAVPGERASY
ncbi:Tectonic-3 [Manis pentadactyla]|nr:Tectonic-3 [Manis pentadactyla]